MPEQKLNRAIACYQQGQTGQAHGLCAEILTKQPAHPAANRLMAALLGASGKTDSALVHIRRALEQAPEDLEALLTLASLQRAARATPARPRQHCDAPLHCTRRRLSR
ncbi:MAG: hypothetical protein IIB68_01520 [Proteobacteria bacterium]|nr:hypothetical protein [Pseudomonadota bacterium]